MTLTWHGGESNSQGLFCEISLQPVLGLPGVGSNHEMQWVRQKSLGSIYLNVTWRHHRWKIESYFLKSLDMLPQHLIAEIWVKINDVQHVSWFVVWFTQDEHFLSGMNPENGFIACYPTLSKGRLVELKSAESAKEKCGSKAGVDLRADRARQGDPFSRWFSLSSAIHNLFFFNGFWLIWSLIFQLKAQLTLW